MKDSYTIGQLAQLAGVTRKTLRVYEQKGLLKPLRNTENGYRLYGADALRTMEKIQVMRCLDFSLDQISDFLKLYENAGRESMLLEQKRLIEKKIGQLKSVSACVDRALGECKGQEQNSEEFLRSLGNIVKNQRADELVIELIKHTNEPEGWSRFIFDKSQIKPNMKILDAGAGYGNLWRYNKDRLPQNLRITCIDKHNTHMETFQADAKNDDVLSQKGIDFVYDDLESMEIKGRYDRIYFNHVAGHIADRLSLYRKLSETLSKEGVFICTWGGMLFYENLQSLMKGFLSNDEYSEFNGQYKKHKEQYTQREGELKEVFGSVERLSYVINLNFATKEEFAEYISQVCHPVRDMAGEKRSEFVEYLEGYKTSDGSYSFARDTYLYYCKKEK